MPETTENPPVDNSTRTPANAATSVGNQTTQAGAAAPLMQYIDALRGFRPASGTGGDNGSTSGTNNAQPQQIRIEDMKFALAKARTDLREAGQACDLCQNVFCSCDYEAQLPGASTAPPTRPITSSTSVGTATVPDWSGLLNQRSTGPSPAVATPAPVGAITPPTSAARNPPNQMGMMPFVAQPKTGGGNTPNFPFPRGAGHSPQGGHLPQSFLKSIKLEKFTGEISSKNFREWFPLFERYAQAHSTPLKVRGDALYFALDGQALGFANTSGGSTRTSDYFNFVRALDTEFQPVPTQAYATQVQIVKQFPDEQIAAFIRRMQKLIFLGYPGIPPQTAGQMAMTALRNGCLHRYRGVLNVLPNTKGIEEVKQALINFEHNTAGASELLPAACRPPYRQRQGIMAIGSAQQNPPEQNEQLVQSECTIPSDEPITACQMGQVVQEYSSRLAKDTTKAVAEANQQVVSSIKELRRQMEEIRGGRGNQQGNSGQGNGSFRGCGRVRVGFQNGFQ